MHVFLENDYKQIIRYYLNLKSEEERGVSRKLAEHLGVNPALVSQIISGERDFTEEQIFSVCEYFEIAKLETEYIWTLLQIERSGTVALKDHYRQLKLNIQKKAISLGERVTTNRSLDDNEKAIFYSTWLYSAIHVLSSLEKGTTMDEVVKRFRLNPKKANDAIEFLAMIGFIKNHKGHLTAGPSSSHLDANSPFISRHHTQWRIKAIEKSADIDPQELMYTANFSISKKDFLKLREDLVIYINKFLETVKDSPPEDIAQLNIDFFWINK